MSDKAETKGAKDSPDIVRMEWKTQGGDEINVSIEEIENGFLVRKRTYKHDPKDKMSWDERNVEKTYYSKEKPEIMEDVNIDDFIL